MMHSLIKMIGVITVIGVIVMSCDSVVDSDSNISDAVEVQAFESTSNSSHTELVTDDNIGDDWDPNVEENSGIAITTDYEAPTGFSDAALFLFTEDNNAARAELGTSVSVRLDEVGSLNYWTYQPDGNPDIAATAYKMVVTFDGGWTTLIYEPYWQNGLGDAAPIVGGEWQQWENIQDGNWWSSNGDAGIPTGVAGPPFVTLDEVLALQPDAVVEYIQLGIGSYNPDWSVLADGMTFAGTTYNFDLKQDPTSKMECKNGAWEELGFSNQGQCIRFVNTGQDSR